MPGLINYEAMRMTPDRIRSDTSKCDETRQGHAFATDAYDLLRIINTLNTSGKITFIL